MILIAIPQVIDEWLGRNEKKINREKSNDKSYRKEED